MAVKISKPVSAGKQVRPVAVGKRAQPVAPAKTYQPVSRPAAPRAAASPSTGSRSNYSSPVSSFSMPGGGGGGDLGGGGDSLAVQPPSEEDYLAGDSAYQATIAALARQLQGFQSDIDTQRSNRKLDYESSLKDLGYRAPGAAGGPADWNWDDVLTASGRAYQNNSNDFASRGMLQSQAYADSINNLQRSLMDQFNGIDQTNTQFNSDLDRQLTKTRDENTSAQQQARADAIMRRAAQYGLGG